MGVKMMRRIAPFLVAVVLLVSHLAQDQRFQKLGRDTKNRARPPSPPLKPAL
jgi:hypothetical protein